MLSNNIKRATDFGTLRSERGIFSFTLKIIFYIIPAIIFGNYTDVFVKYIQRQRLLGDNVLYYIILQTLIIILTMYLIVVFLSDFKSEFQVTIAGGYFIVLYFGIQTNYIRMIQEYMN